MFSLGAPPPLGHEWAVILEDDGLPVKGFREQAGLALAAAPDPVVSFYLGRRRPPQFQVPIANALHRADEADACWIRWVEGLHGVASAMRTDLVDGFLARRDPQLPIDQAMGRWACGEGLQISYSTPSLVDHADAPTLVQAPAD